MENHSPWQLVRAGFWIGVGFMVPSALIGFASIGFMGYAVSSFEESFESSLAGVVTPDLDGTEGIELGPWRTESHGKRLLILGTVENTRSTKVGSTQLEAEFFDADGTYVYECSEYISNDLPPGGTENYQITCGCRSSGIPEYDRIEVRVIGASSY